jgi:gas vesicle protein
MSSFKRHLSWFLVGVGVGTAVSLLFAPLSGEDLQDRIASSAREGIENAKRGSRQAVETVGDLVDSGQEVAKDVGSQWKGYVDRGRDVISEHAEKL